MRNGCESKWEVLAGDAGWAAEWRVAVVWGGGVLVAVPLAARKSGTHEPRTASKHRRPGSGDGASGSPVVDLDTDAGLIAAVAPLYPAHPSIPSQVSSSAGRLLNALQSSISCRLLALVLDG